MCIVPELRSVSSLGHRRTLVLYRQSLFGNTPYVTRINNGYLKDMAFESTYENPLKF